MRFFLCVWERKGICDLHFGARVGVKSNEFTYCWFCQHQRQLEAKQQDLVWSASIGLFTDHWMGFSRVANLNG